MDDGPASTSVPVNCPTIMKAFVYRQKELNWTTQRNRSSSRGIVEAAFTLSSPWVEWATELVRSFEEHQKTRKEVFTFHGQMTACLCCFHR
ncbi:hypothetical protein BsWGS_21960 [Bradybaena similaris]